MKKLQLFNGRGAHFLKYGDPRIPGRFSSVTLYVGGYSRADAARLVERYCGRRPSAGETKNYWSPCWGNGMRGIAPARGVWIQFDYDPPIHVVDCSGEPPDTKSRWVVGRVGAALTCCVCLKPIQSGSVAVRHRTRSAHEACAQKENERSARLGIKRKKVMAGDPVGAKGVGRRVVRDTRGLGG